MEDNKKECSCENNEECLENECNEQCQHEGCCKEKNDNCETNEECEKKEKKNKPKDKIVALEQEVLELKDQLLRNRAELENFKKRTTEERIKDRKYASLGLITDLLTYLDTLDKTVKMPTDNEVLKNFLIGFKMINDQIFEVLKTDGLSEIKSIDLAFDPNIHQAVEKEKIEGKEPGIVIQELQKGYMYKDRVLRPAMVKVSE